MNARRAFTGVITLAVGYALAAGLFWLLLQVPESTVGTLLASLVLAIATVVCAGATTAGALAIGTGASWRPALRRCGRAMPLFVSGLVVLAALWWLASAAANWWSAHRGELDALALRYLRTDRTAAAHDAIAWLLWLLPWGAGLSLLGGLTAAGQRPERLPVRALAGVRAGLSALSVAVVTAAAVLFSQVIWRLAYWRPEGLPASSTELAFVMTKLGLLYVAFIGLTAIALFAIDRRLGQAPVVTNEP